MKSKLLRQVIEMSKITLYGFAIQCILYGAIVADDLNAQNLERSIQEVYISLDVNDVPLKQVLYQIEAKTGFVFAYNLDKIDLNHKVSLNVRKSDLASVLMQISKDSNLKFKRINNNIHIGVRKKYESIQIEEKINEQELTITGQVTSSEDNLGLPGVNVIVQGTTNGTITDIDGNYSISNVPEGAILEFSSVGFVREVVEIGSRTVINIALVPDVQQLSEIVVIGYGEREKKDLTGAISAMGEKDIEKSIALAPEFAMQGQMAGVLVTSPSGLPTDRPTVRIRGVGTMGVNDPLYVIDGVPITEYGAGAEGSASVVQDVRGQVNVMSMINPSDIESISVLKDASAAAIYGVRAANGVILITTKKGKEGKPKVDFNFRTGVQNFAKKYSVLNTQQYTELYQESHAANPNYDLPAVFDPTSDSYLGDKPTFDWINPFVNENAATTDASVKVYGGTEATNYYISAGYAYTEAPIRTNQQERYSFSTNVNTKVAKWIEAGINYRLSYSEAIDQNSTLDATISAPPWQPLYYEDDYAPIGSPVEEKYGLATVWDSVTSPNPAHPNFGGTNDDAAPYLVDWISKYGTEASGNGLSGLDSRLNKNQYNILRNIGSAYVKFKLYDGLTLKGNISIDYYHNQRERWSSVDAVFFSPTPGNPYATGDGTSLGNLNYRNSWNFNMVKEATLDYNKSFGDHNINVTLNAMDQKYTYRLIGTSSEQNIQENPDKRLIVESEDYTTVGEMAHESTLLGFMARASYNYASKYYIDATVRRDGTSRFAPDYRWGTFPSVALAWRMSGESFMANIDWINDFKWRAGWGQLGNQETKEYAFLSLVNLSPQYAYGSGLGDGYGYVQNGLFLPDFPTYDLSWETATTTNIGFDAIFLKNRFTVTLEYYNRLTTDILQSVQFPASVGNYNAPIINVASVQNQGIELQLGWSDNIGELGYYVNGNFTTVDNKVVDVWNDQPLLSSNLRIEEGYSMNTIWGYKVGGIFQSQEEIDQWYEQYEGDDLTDASLVSPGDMYFQDVHGDPDPDNGYDYFTPEPDGKINDNDKTYIGNTIPKYYYGFTLGVTWKNFDLSGFFQGIGGVYKINWALNAGVRMDGQGNNQWTNVLNRWTESNKNEWDPNDRANALPRAVRGDPAGNNRFSDRWVERADYLRLRNLTLGYTVPQTLLGEWDYIDRVRLYISGTNLMTLTKWSGIDPENDAIPIPVTWSFGVNATF